MLRRVERVDAAAAPGNAAGRPPPKRGTKNVPSDAQHSEPPGRSDEPRASFLRRWPAALWLLVYVGSIFILNGSNGDWDPLQLALGIGLAAIACALAMYLALGSLARPRPAAVERHADRRRHRLLPRLRA